ncbi:S8 family serine peptidase [Chryseobacterium koreense]|uniref:Peptidase S8 n=1 Tax=Chryseobacterium koreense CCUG 49689 TaxID=1304281 RepID=A0A0J7IXC0_9FLAO|nr:S8 family serine peptidase [Chryseobacterium koreense]KMQ70597.1 peptidase S8 [Chryseobacterium koreense CCUG 49689]MBB5334404.1 subtilisin family serine protease [Chryseobacterium koreense]
MKKILIAACFMTGFATFAQTAESALDPMKDKDLMTWYHKDFSATNVYGVNTQNAYKYLESKGLKPRTVVVGVLDSGVQVDHPGLVKNMWKNPNEIPNNGKDDDGNGYVDDIYGWNFIGGKNGDVDVDNMEVTRVVKKYQPIFEGTDSSANKANQAKMPEEFAMYMKSKEIFTKKSIEGKQAFETYSMIQKMIPSMVAMLDGKNLTPEVVAAIKPATQEQAMAASVLAQIAQDPAVKGKSPAEAQKFLEDQMKEALDYYGPQATKQYNLDYDPRASMVGDHYEDYSEKFYGNNHYEGPDAKHGTHVSGIIAGYPQGTETQYGVAYKVAKIMTVRAVPDGDERDKDVANAIRYAVDNGAKILNMSFGKPVSPGKEYVWDAFKYAQDKGVLLVKAAGNENEDISENVAYPTNYKDVKDAKPFINNMIVVGASTNDNEFLRASFSNYNQKMVDVFAPGDKIYSTVPTNKYEYLQGTSMAAPVVAGGAAVLLAYMPNLKPEQIIEAFVKTANKSSVNAMIKSNTNNRFDMISESGGVIDLRKAAEYAYTHFYKPSPSVETLSKPAPNKPMKKTLKKVVKTGN